MKKFFVFCLGISFLLTGCTLPSSDGGTSVSPDEARKNMETVCAFLKEAGVYYLATAEGDQPRVRPFGTALIFEGRLYIQTGRK